MGLCSCCGKPLNSAVWSADGCYKSCPLCSVTHGSQHVFRRYPEDFGTTEARVTVNNPDGAQSYCVDCRALHKGELSQVDLSQQRLCDAMEKV